MRDSAYTCGVAFLNPLSRELGACEVADDAQLTALEGVRGFAPVPPRIRPVISSDPTRYILGFAPHHATRAGAGAARRARVRRAARGEQRGPARGEAPPRRARALRDPGERAEGARGREREAERRHARCALALRCVQKGASSFLVQFCAAGPRAVRRIRCQPVPLTRKTSLFTCCWMSIAHAGCGFQRQGCRDGPLPPPLRKLRGARHLRLFSRCSLCTRAPRCALQT